MHVCVCVCPLLSACNSEQVSLCEHDCVQVGLYAHTGMNESVYICACISVHVMLTHA